MVIKQIACLQKLKQLKKISKTRERLFLLKLRLVTLEVTICILHGVAQAKLRTEFNIKKTIIQ